MSAAEEKIDFRILSQRSARTFYNVADAWGVEGPDAIEALGPGVARSLRHRGVGAARRTWLALAWVEWGCLLGSPAGRGFSRRTRDQRLARLEGLERGWGRWAVVWLRGLMEEAGAPLAR